MRFFSPGVYEIHIQLSIFANSLEPDQTPSFSAFYSRNSIVRNCGDYFYKPESSEVRIYSHLG